MPASTRNYAQAKAALESSPQPYAQTIDGEIERIEDSKTVIVNKLNSMTGLATTSSIDVAALDLEGITVTKNTSYSISPGDTYALPAGYYSGYSVIANGATHDYDLGSVTGVVPSTTTQTITAANAGTNPSTGNPYYGLSSVQVLPIPSTYADITGVTATASHVLDGDVFVNAQGQEVTGTMADHSTSYTQITTIETLSAGRDGQGNYNDYYYVIPQGYHDGKERIAINLETCPVTLSSLPQTIDPTSGNVFGRVTVPAVAPADWLPGWTSDANATSGDILTSKSAYVNGVKIDGSMLNQGTWDAATHILTTTSDESVRANIPVGYHDGTGVVSITPEDKSVSLSDLTTHTSSWDVVASANKVLRTVTIAGIPATYVDTSTATATSSDIVSPKTAYVNGSLVTGSIQATSNYAPDATSAVLASGPSGAPSSSPLISFNEAVYRGGGKITLTSAIYDRLNAI